MKIHDPPYSITLCWNDVENTWDSSKVFNHHQDLSNAGIMRDPSKFRTHNAEDRPEQNISTNAGCCRPTRPFKMNWIHFPFLCVFLVPSYQNACQGNRIMKVWKCTLSGSKCKIIRSMRMLVYYNRSNIRPSRRNFGISNLSKCNFVWLGQQTKTHKVCSDHRHWGMTDIAKWGSYSAEDEEGWTGQ